MKLAAINKPERGIALVVSLLFLLVLTIISVVAASNSTLGLKMTANMQDVYASFQSAEAGAFAVLGLAGAPDPNDDPFRGADNATPFAGIAKHPLEHLPDGQDSVDVNVRLKARAGDCPRPRRPVGANSITIFDCDYYQIASEHEVAGKARTKVDLGVIKQVIGSR